MKSISHLASTALLLVLVACDAGNGAPVTTTPTPVSVTTAVEGPSAAPIRGTGTLAHRHEARLALTVAGVIGAIHVEEGASVRAGQVLAELQLTEIDSRVAQARELLRKAQRDLERGEHLAAQGLIARERVDDLRTQTQVAAETLRAAEFHRRHAVIRAPSAGVILRKLAEANETVAAGTPILMLGAEDAGWILRAGLSDRDLVQLELGDHAKLRFDAVPGRVFDARVTRLAGAADPRSGLFDIELGLDPGAQRLASGMVARFEIQPERADAPPRVYVPIAALIEGEGERASVYTLAADGRSAVRRAVEVAFIDGEQVALRAGLEAGESVIVAGAGFVAHGRPVRVQAQPEE